MMKMENGAVASAVANYMNNVEAIGKYGNELHIRFIFNNNL